MYKYECCRCGCRLDPGEGVRYPGEGLVCEDCVEELDLETAHRKLFAMTKGQQKELKQILPGIVLGDYLKEKRKKIYNFLYDRKSQCKDKFIFRYQKFTR